MHEAILGEPLDKRNFRRKIIQKGIVKAVKEWQQTGRKPAQLYGSASSLTVMTDPSSPQTVTLYRPTGEKELSLVRESGWRAFPPRLPGQPIFYPVLNETYATQIARDWNTRDGETGYVLRFRVNAEFIARYQVQTVGSGIHQEYWIPAGDLDEFNRNVVGPIEVISTFAPLPSQ